MIELVLSEQCNGCGECVVACPSNVFERDAQGRAVIARQEDCQTCFMCELYCRQDALYVHPDCEGAKPRQADEVRAQGLLGQFRRESGWHEWQGVYPNDHWRMDEVFRRARGLVAR